LRAGPERRERTEAEDMDAPEAFDALEMRVGRIRRADRHPAARTPASASEAVAKIASTCPRAPRIARIASRLRLTSGDAAGSAAATDALILSPGIRPRAACAASCSALAGDDSAAISAAVKLRTSNPCTSLATIISARALRSQWRISRIRRVCYTLRRFAGVSEAGAPDTRGFFA
jgi:hypothetical protein